jgi:hypothetical protein
VEPANLGLGHLDRLPAIRARHRLARAGFIHGKVFLTRTHEIDVRHGSPPPPFAVLMIERLNHNVRFHIQNIVWMPRVNPENTIRGKNPSKFSC